MYVKIEQMGIKKIYGQHFQEALHHTVHKF